MPEFIDQFAQSFADDPRFDLFIRGLSRLGGPNGSDLDILMGEESAEVIGRLREVARLRGLNLAESKEGVPICYASRASSFVVRANGRLNRCTVALEHPNNQVGAIRQDGTVVLDPSLMSRWMRGLKSEDPEELGCPMIGYAETSSPGAIRLPVTT